MCCINMQPMLQWSQPADMCCKTFFFFFFFVVCKSVECIFNVLFWKLCQRHISVFFNWKQKITFLSIFLSVCLSVYSKHKNKRRTAAQQGNVPHRGFGLWCRCYIVAHSRFLSFFRVNNTTRRQVCRVQARDFEPGQAEATRCNLRRSPMPPGLSRWRPLAAN